MKRSAFLSSLFILALLVAALPATAGGPLANCRPGQPFLWGNGGQNIPFNPDQGGLGTLTNTQAVMLVEDSFQAWEDVPTSTAAYFNAGPIPVDVDITNFIPFLFPAGPDGLSSIVFDENGEIFDLLFGPGTGILGFAGPEFGILATCEITEGVAFLNGSAINDPTVALDINVHEFGHYTNLAHTVVNGQIVIGDNTGPTPFDTFPLTTLVDRVETMYPFYFGTAAGFRTPDPDDEAIISTLYPEPFFFSTTGTIAGSVLFGTGGTPLTGVNVIARNVNAPFDDAVSAISSDFTDNTVPGADPFVGTFRINGLTPGARYALYVDEILAGGFSTPPLVPLPGPEEFRSGQDNTLVNVPDSPNMFIPIVPVAGVPRTGQNIVLHP